MVEENSKEDLLKVYKYVYNCKKCNRDYGSDKIDNTCLCPIHENKKGRFKR
jgi:hypothetical protein